MNKTLNNYKRANIDVVKLFIRKYYGKLKDVEYFAVGGKKNIIQTVWCINDNYYNISDMIEYMVNKYNTEQIFEHYNYVLDLAMKNKKPKFNIEHWLLVKTNTYK